MRIGRVVLETAANGFAWVMTESGGRYLWLASLLRLRHGFGRSGSAVVGPDQTLFPDFVRGDLRLHAGRDSWVGYHLLATDLASDGFLRDLFAKHCRNAKGGA